MLFGKKKFSYLTMMFTYFKIVPGEVIIKIISNIVRSIIPTLSIIITAKFLDAAVAIVADRNKLGAVIFHLCAIIGISLFNYYVGIIIGLVNTRAGNKMRKVVSPKIAEKKAVVKFRYYEHQESVDIMNRAMGGFEGNLQGFFDQAFNAWNIIAQIIGFVLILGMQLWWASIAFAITCIPSFVISYNIGKKKYAIDNEMSKIDRKAGYISGILTSRDTIEERYIYGYTEKMNDEYKYKYEFARIARKKVDRQGWVNRTSAGILVFISGIIVIAILLPSAVFPDANGEIKLTIGMFTALVNAIIGLSQQMRWSISTYISDFKYKFEYLKDLNKFLEFEEDKDAACLPDVNIPELKTIKFKNVSFKYPGTEPYILKNFSVKFEVGKHYSIVGMNGAGKTTLTKLLTKLYDEYEGEIFINNKELREYKQAEIKALSAVVYQDFCRYPIDFYNNIAIGNANSMHNREKVENATSIIGLAEVVDKLPRKYETPITKIKEGGVDLSGGEWQRIALARLIINPAPLKILDEPTASLDPISESQVYEQFKEIVDQNQKNQSTGITIFISHRLGSTKLADEIIVISEGKAMEIGTFDELMTKDAIYANMFKSQSEWYKESNVDCGNKQESSGGVYA
ncbi:MAG: ABC transporter ATP-binding protein/permease [Bacteroidales bacterium]|jgi:ABC-type multidrug transport system fused ATPase/permease subunit|nr:ABC transporter ATP-binding protein/permease [Bacteroidales bacterium]